MSHHRTPSATVLADAVIDSKEFVPGSRLDGEVPVARLERLTDVLAETAGTLRVALAGESDSEGYPCLRIQVAGILQLRCQRCLEKLEMPVAIDSVLRLVERELPTEGGEEELDATAPDVIVAEGELAVLSLLEDEILLSLPLAPRHKRCEMPSGGEKDRAPSPFAALAQLKKH
jgi:uncharacterized protein